MRRRALLSTLGVTLATGCVADTGDGSGDDDDDDTQSRTVQTTPKQPPVTTTTPTAPAPDVGVEPTEAAGPPWDERIDRVLAWPDVSDETPIALTPPTQTESLPGATVEFTLTNGSETRFETNFYGWSVWKHVGSEWFHIAPTAWPEPLMFLEPGDAHTWTLTIDNDDIGDDIEWANGTADIALPGLGGGTYAFTIDGWFTGQSYEQSVGFVSQFTLDGDPVELVPTSKVTETTRDGDTVVVETNHSGGDESRKAAFVVNRLREGSDIGENGTDESDADEEMQRLITEQVFRDRELRNTLPFFEEGVNTVWLEEQNSTHPVFGLNGPRIIEYEGERYRLSAMEL